jgi:glycosyltransferase involved in cell wall biosynthesis
LKGTSVIITTKNRREELLKAVESAMSQRGLLEVIVIDDGSTDGTEAAVMEMLKKDLTTIEHGGRCENRKLGKAEGRATDSWPQGGAASGTMQVIEQPEVGPKGEEAGASESKGEAGLTTDDTDGHGYSAGLCLTGQAGASEPDSLASKLADSTVSESLIRSADGPASLPATRHSPPVTTGSPVLRLIRHEVSAGYIVRRNEGARLAKGDVIFSLDDDAVFSSPFVVEQTLRDFSHPRIGAVAIPYIEPHKANKEMQRAPTREDVWITASYIGTAHAVRRDVFLARGGYREHLVHQGEEGDFCLRMLAAKPLEEKAETLKSGKRKADLTTIEHRGRGEMEQPKVGPKGEEAGASESKGEAGLTTDYPDGHGWEKRRATPREPGLALSSQNSSTSEPARDSENTSLNRSAIGSAEAHRSGEMGSGGGNQLAESEVFLGGQSQAGLQMDSQKHLTPRAAMGSTSSGDNSSSVSIREIRGKKKSGVQEALDASLPATSHSLPVTAPEVPGFFVRLGNSDPIIHNESPKRDYSRMDFYGRRNDVLFHWQNTPMPNLLWQLPMTIAGGLLCAAKVGRWRKMLEGVGAGLLAIAGGVKREPVSKRVVSLHKVLKRSTQKFRIFIQ